MRMVKTQVSLPEEALRELRRIARTKRRPVADLILEAVRAMWLRPEPSGQVALWDGPFAGSSRDHDAAFDDP